MFKDEREYLIPLTTTMAALLGPKEREIELFLVRANGKAFEAFIALAVKKNSEFELEHHKTAPCGGFGLSKASEIIPNEARNYIV